MKISREEWTILGGLVAVLAVASLTGFVLRVRGRAVDNLNARIRSWWIIVALLAAADACGQERSDRVVRGVVLRRAA